MEIKTTYDEMLKALNSLDNLEACNQLNAKALKSWETARKELLKAMGSLIACEINQKNKGI